MNKRIVSICIGGGLLIIFVWLVVFTFKPSLSTQITATPGVSAPTSTWKTYSNNKFGFQFQYPSNVSVSDEGPYTSQSGSQPDSLDVVRISGADSNVGIAVFNSGIVHGDYNWPERPCGEWTFGPDSGPLSSEKIIFAGEKTLHLVVRGSGDNTSPAVNNFYCINYSPNPIVINFNQPPSLETQKILASFKFLTTAN
jgi:hypothetical protein